TGTFDVPTIQQQPTNGQLILEPRTEMLLFLSFFFAFAIKVPLFPLHTWLPDAHVEARTAGSVMLAGVLLKMGTYGMMRFCLPLFPNASRRCAGWIAVLAIIGIIYGALVSLVQPNLKKLVAYSSVSHLGFVVLGIFALHNISMQGAVYQMLAHGISTGALFLLVGMLYDRRHTVEKNKTLPDVSAREKWILVTMAVVTLWMGIGSAFFTRRTAASVQNVLEQMGSQSAQEAVVPKTEPKAAKPAVTIGALAPTSL